MKTLRLTENRLRSLIREVVEGELNGVPNQKQLWNELYNACMTLYPFNEFVEDWAYEVDNCEVNDYDQSSMEQFNEMYPFFINEFLEYTSDQNNESHNDYYCNSLSEVYSLYKNNPEDLKNMLKDFILP